VSEKHTEIMYSTAIRDAFHYLLKNYPNIFVIGQGLWSPWYVGNSMINLDKEFGLDRIIDTPISEDAITSIAAGASLCGYRPIVVHPRMDFMILASNSIVNQIAKWSHMLGGQSHPSLTIRGIINRGGEQGAQHSQALHSLYTHIPGLRVVMPATVKDARDLLIASVLCDDPVLYIDDRWCYNITDSIPTITELNLPNERPKILMPGSDITLVGCGYTTLQCLEAAQKLRIHGISAEVVDLRILNPINDELIIGSVEKTGHLCAVDGGWTNCGLGAEIIARVSEKIHPQKLKSSPLRINTPDTPAPTSKPLEASYYFTSETIEKKIMKLLNHV